MPNVPNPGNRTDRQDRDRCANREYRKASRTGHAVLASALPFMVIGCIAALAGSSAVALTSTGLCVALLVVGLLLHFEGVRQQLRPERLQPR